MSRENSAAHHPKCGKPHFPSAAEARVKGPRDTHARARNWRARRFRVNALASQPGRSRFAACVRRFATRVCVRGGLPCFNLGWARGEAPPSTWPTVAATSAVCLSEHRTGSRVFLSLVQCSRGARTRTHKRPRGSKRDSASARRESGGL